MPNTAPCIENGYQPEQAKLILSSFRRVVGKPLIDIGDKTVNPYQTLYEAPFCVLSHGTEKDPIFNYGNQSTLTLFEFDWTHFTQLPSRYSAELQIQEERDRLLKEVTEKGFIDDYRGIRVSSSGQRFLVEKAIVWNMHDEQDVYRGQAAVLYQWSEL